MGTPAHPGSSARHVPANGTSVRRRSARGLSISTPEPLRPASETRLPPLLVPVGGGKDRRVSCSLYDLLFEWHPYFMLKALQRNGVAARSLPRIHGTTISVSIRRRKNAWRTATRPSCGPGTRSRRGALPALLSALLARFGYAVVSRDFAAATRWELVVLEGLDQPALKYRRKVP